MGIWGGMQIYFGLIFSHEKVGNDLYCRVNDKYYTELEQDNNCDKHYKMQQI